MTESSLSVKISADTSELVAASARAEAAVTSLQRQLRAAALADVKSPTAESAAAIDRMAVSLVGAKTAAAAARAALAATTPPVKLAGEAMHGLELGTAGASREIIVLAHEMLQGRFSRIPGSILVLGERMGGLHTIISRVGSMLSAIPAPAYAAAAAIAAIAADFGVMALRAHEAERAATAAVASAAARNIALPQTQAEADIVEIRKVASVSAEEAQKILYAFESMHGATAASINAMIKLLPDWAASIQEKPVEAADNMAKVLGNLGGEGEKWMASMNASQAAINQFDAALAKGDNATAFTILLRQMGDMAERVESKLHLANQEAREAASIRLNSGPAAGMIPGGNSGIPGQTSPMYKAAVSAIDQKQIQEQADALAGASGAAYQQQEAKPTGAPLDEVREQIEAQKALMEEGGKSQEEIARMEADTWAKRIAVGDLAGKELVSAETALASARVQAMREGGNAAVAAARQHIADMQAEGKLGTNAMIQAEAATWRGVLATASLSAEQRKQVERNLDETLAKLHATERDQHLKSLEGVTDAARKGSQERIAAAEREVAFTVSAWGKGSDQAIAAQKRVTEAQQAAQQQQEALAMEWASFQQRQATEVVAAKKAALQQQVQDGAVSAGAQYTTLAQYQTQEYQALKASLDAQLADEKKTAAEKLKIWEELYEAGIKYQREMADDARKESQAVQQDWLKALQPVQKGFDTLVRDMLTGHMRLGMAAKRAAAQMVVDFIEADVKMLMHFVATQAAKLAAQMVGDQASVASNAAANTEKGASDSMSGLLAITKHAASAAAAVYDDVAQIPYVGWLLAPIAAGAAFVAVEAFGAMIPSAAGGMVMGGDGLIMAHAQEMVLPAHLSSGIQGIIDAGGGGGAGGAGGNVNLMPQFNVQALDAKSVVALFNSPQIMRQLTANMQRYMAMNPSVRGAY